MTTSKNELPAYQLLVDYFVWNKVEILSLEHVEIDRPQDFSSRVAVDHKNKLKGKSWPRKMDMVRFQNVATDISDYNKTNVKTYSSFPSLQKSKIRRHDRDQRERVNRRHANGRHHRSSTPLPHNRYHSKSVLQVAILVNERYETAVGCRLYLPTLSS